MKLFKHPLVQKALLADFLLSVVVIGLSATYALTVSGFVIGLVAVLLAFKWALKISESSGEQA